MGQHIANWEWFGNLEKHFRLCLRILLIEWLVSSRLASQINRNNITCQVPYSTNCFGAMRHWPYSASLNGLSFVYALVRWSYICTTNCIGGGGKDRSSCALGKHSTLRAQKRLFLKETGMSTQVRKVVTLGHLWEKQCFAIWIQEPEAFRIFRPLCFNL